MAECLESSRKIWRQRAQHFLPLKEEEVVLTQVQNELASVKNPPKADLSEDLQLKLKSSLNAAIKWTIHRLRAIPTEIKQQEKALRHVTKKLQVINDRGESLPETEGFASSETSAGSLPSGNLWDDISGSKQRALVKCLQGKQAVTIGSVLLAVYNSKSESHLGALAKLVVRTNHNLTAKNKLHEIKRQGNTYQLKQI